MTDACQEVPRIELPMLTYQWPDWLSGGFPLIWRPSPVWRWPGESALWPGRCESRRPGLLTSYGGKALPSAPRFRYNPIAPWELRIAELRAFYEVAGGGGLLDLVMSWNGLCYLRLRVLVPVVTPTLTKW